MNENENSSGKSFDKETKVEALAKLSSTFYRFFGAEAEFDYEHTKTNGTHDNHVSKDIVQKTLHDAAYNIAYDYISEHLNKAQVKDLEEYVEISGDFQYIDFKSLVSYFNENGLIDFIKKEELKKIKIQIDTEFESLNRKARRNNQQEISRRKRVAKDAIDNKYKEIDDIIKLLHNILPCDRMYISNKGYIIPIDDRYLRDYPESFGFKYGGSMTCLGYVTNIIGKDTHIEDNSNAFASLQHGINESLRSILPLSDDNLYIITPIAIYYTNNEAQNHTVSLEDTSV
ncbi:MAG: hypothetical protein IJY19_07150 [Ruminococcus sp.]|nr:hypothetical protein [Ruminococcus sp.]